MELEYVKNCGINRKKIIANLEYDIKAKERIVD